MSWSIRHQGSPRSVDGLSAQQVVGGLQDGLYEPTDEIKSDADSNWVALENHPQFADLAAEFEPMPPPVHDDETRLDMNPLIDVCLVLLIFFILTTSYGALQKVLDIGGVTSVTLGKVVKTKEQVQQFTIKVEVRLENGQPVIRVEDQVTDPNNLQSALRSWVNSKGKTELLIDAVDNVDWGTIVAIQDAATGAGISKIHFQVKPGEVR
jgi:biopolymer transport protein ExbD